MKRHRDKNIAERLGAQEAAPPTIVPRVLVDTALADLYIAVDGPIGRLYVAFNPVGVSSIVPADDVATFIDVHSRTVGRPAYATDSMPANLESALRRTLTTGRTGELPLDLRQLTPFQRGVLETTAQIPPGETRPYGWVARELGKAGAVRAVGSALGRNPVPVVVPCHRVVRSDGAVGNYAFGPAMKVALLTHEGVDPTLLAPGSLRFTGSDTTGIFCYPTCRHARRIADDHRAVFRSPAQATAAGYRPCKVCRPA